MATSQAITYCRICEPLCGLEATVADDSSVRELLDRVVKREIDPASAAKELLERDDG